MPRTATAPAPAAPAHHDPFAVLLDKRISYGKLAELNRSHYTPDSEEDGWLDQLVDALTDELEYRFPQQWARIEDHVYAAEAMFFHLPHDPNTDDGPPLFLQCPRCRDLAAAHHSPGHRPDDPGALARSAQPARRSTSDRGDAAAAAAHIQKAS